MPMSRMKNENNIIIRFTTVFMELLIINLLTLLCCLPIITIGPALTAFHDACIKIVRKEEGYIARRFFTVFRRDLKSSILLFLPFLFIFLGAAADLFIGLTAPGLLPQYVSIPAGAAGLLAFFFFQWVFPIQARFHGSFTGILKTAFFLAVARFPRTLAMALMWLIPVFLSRYLLTLPFAVLFGLSLPGIFSALFYCPVFEELEET